MTDIAAWGLAWLGWPLKGLFPSEGRDEDKNEPSKNHISCVFLTYLICDVSTIKFLVGNILLMAYFCDVFRSKANALNVSLSTTNNWATEQCRQSNVFTHFLFIPGKEDEEDKVEPQRSFYSDRGSTIFETCCTETTDYATSCCSSDSFHSDKDDEHWTFLASKQSERRSPESKKSERRPPERKSEEIPDSLLIEAFPNVMQRRTNCSPLNSRNGSLPLEERTSEVSENVEAFTWFEDKMGEKTLFQEGYGQENEVCGESGLHDKRQNAKEVAVEGSSQKGYGRDCGKTMWTFDLPAEDSTC